MSTALTIPDPRQQNVPVGWFESVAPAVEEMSWEDLDDAEGQLRAVASFVESFDGDSLEYEKALRLVECRRGVLLGVDVKPGDRTDLEPSHACEGVRDVNRRSTGR